MSKELSQEVIDKIINDYKNNIPIIQIAKTYHIGHTTIEKIIKDNNLTRPSRYELPQETIDNIINDFNKPMSISEVALKYNMSRARIRRILNNNGLEHRQKLHLNKLSQDTINEILEKYKNGISFNQLEKQYHCSKETIREYLIKNNIPLHKSEINLEELLPEIIKDFNQPMSINAIAEKYNLHRSTIQRLLKENNQNINRPFYKNIFSEEQINSIINDFNLPMRICNIADKYHSKPETVRKILIDNNQDVNRPFYKNVLNDKQIMEIIDQYNKGTGLIELAGKYHISSDTLKELLTTNNINIRMDNVHEKISDNIIQQLIHDYTVNNLAIKELSTKYNVVLGTIYRIFKRNNIKVNKLILD